MILSLAVVTLPFTATVVTTDMTGGCVNTAHGAAESAVSFIHEVA